MDDNLWWIEMLLTIISGLSLQYQTKSRAPPKQRAAKTRTTSIFHIQPMDLFFSTKTAIFCSTPASTSVAAAEYSTIVLSSGCCALGELSPRTSLCVRMNFCKGACSIYATAAARAEGKLQWCHSVSGDRAGGSAAAAAERPGRREERAAGKVSEHAASPQWAVVLGWQSGRGSKNDIHLSPNVVLKGSGSNHGQHVKISHYLYTCELLQKNTRY